MLPVWCFRSKHSGSSQWGGVGCASLWPTLLLGTHPDSVWPFVDLPEPWPGASVLRSPFLPPSRVRAGARARQFRGCLSAPMSCGRSGRMRAAPAVMLWLPLLWLAACQACPGGREARVALGGSGPTCREGPSSKGTASRRGAPSSPIWPRRLREGQVEPAETLFLLREGSSLKFFRS